MPLLLLEVSSQEKNYNKELLKEDFPFLKVRKKKKEFENFKKLK
jgi:hypothetical protein